MVLYSEKGAIKMSIFVTASQCSTAGTTFSLLFFH